MKNKRRNFLILGIGLFIIGILLILFAFILGNNNGKNKDDFYDEKYKFSAIKKVVYLNNYFIDKYPIKDFKDIDNNDKLYFIYTVIKDVNNDINTISLEEFNAVSNQFFKLGTIRNKNIKNPETKQIIYKYDATRKEYIRNKKISADISSIYFYRVYDVRKKTSGKKLVVTENIIFMDAINEPTNLYNTANDYLRRENAITSVATLGDVTDEYLNTIKDKLVDTKYNFIKENGKYIIESIK